MPKTWSQETDRSRGTRRNQRVRGGGTWGQQGRRLEDQQQAQLRAQRGRGSWGAETRRLAGERRRREREEKRARSIWRKILGL